MTMRFDGFPKFHALPSELQGSIWIFAALQQQYQERIDHRGPLNYPAAHSAVKLLLVSKAVHPWIENIVYQSIIAYQPRRNTALLSHMVLRPDLYAKTKSIWFIEYDDKDVELALFVLPTLTNLEKASIYLSRRDVDVFACLYNLPNLQELHLNTPFHELSGPQCAALHLTRCNSKVTHLIPSLREDHPGVFASDVLNLFPRMTHLAVIAHSPPSFAWLEGWCNAAPPTLKVLVIIGQHLEASVDKGSIGRLTDTRSDLSIVMFQGKKWNRFNRWYESASMWDDVNEAILCSKSRASESADSPLIVIDAVKIDRAS